MSGEDFLSRWSRRKSAARAAPPAEDPPAASDAPAGVAEAAAPGEPPPPSVSEDEAAGLSDDEILARLDLPHPESVADTDGVRAFLRAGVPLRLKRLALRRMWSVTPETQLACFDGLRDYAEDYTDAALGAGRVSTTYAVGRGLAAHVKHLEDLARRALDPAAPDRDRPDADAVAQPIPTLSEPPEPAAPASPAPASPAPQGRSHARPQVRPPESSPPSRQSQGPAVVAGLNHDQDPVPDENASCRHATDAASPQDNGAAQEARRPRRMVFRFADD